MPSPFSRTTSFSRVGCSADLDSASRRYSTAEVPDRKGGTTGEMNEWNQKGIPNTGCRYRPFSCWKKKTTASPGRTVDQNAVARMSAQEHSRFLAVAWT